jgi:hypothetical protein
MAKKIIVTVVVVIACVLLYYWWTNRSASMRAGDGSVFSTDAKDDTFARSEARPMPSRSDAPGTINTAPVASDAVGNQSAYVAKPSAASPAPYANTSSVPASDTIAPNAPNGLAFGGTGKYQWYRQGNLTWRIDTANGMSCIAFATMEEWRKPIVYTHGCGNA